jgi:hypothetical protein
MNKEGVSTMLHEEVLYYILIAIFLFGMAIYLSGFRNNAALWEEVYAKEISRIIDSSAPGTVVSLDVTRGLRVGLKNGVDLNQAFVFDNVNKKVIVHLRSSGKSSFYYLTNKTVINWHTQPISGGIDKDQLIFTVT